MPKFSNPLSYTGRTATNKFSGQARFATGTEASAGTKDNLIISPKTLADSVDTLLSDASTTVKGKIRISTTAEAVAGTLTTTAVTPANVKSILASPSAIGGTAAAAGTFTTLTANKVDVSTGTASASAGTSGAMTAGTITISTTAVTANSLIFVQPAVLGTVTAPQALYVSTITAGTSFVITSADATDTSTVNWIIFN